MSASAWERYWFRPEPLVNLAVCRVLVVGFQVFVLAFPFAVLVYPPYEMFEIHAAYPDSQYHPPWILRLLTLPLGREYRPTVAHLELVYRVTLGVGCLALAGLGTRASCLLFALGNTFLSAHAYAYGEHHHVECLTVILLFLLAASQSGATLSVDAWLRRRRGAAPRARDASARWPLLLMRWLFALAYLSAALCKLGGGGLDWLNGFTLQYYLLQDGLFHRTPGTWLGTQHGLCVLLSWLTVLAEAGFVLVLWKPRLALLFVPVMAALHAGIYVFQRAPFIHYVVLFCVFVPWSRIGRWIEANGKAPVAGGARG